MLTTKLTALPGAKTNPKHVDSMSKKPPLKTPSAPAVDRAASGSGKIGTSQSAIMRRKRRLLGKCIMCGKSSERSRCNGCSIYKTHRPTKRQWNAVDWRFPNWLIARILGVSYEAVRLRRNKSQNS